MICLTCCFLDRIYYYVSDSENLGDIMSKYYEYFVEAIPRNAIESGLNPMFIKYSSKLLHQRQNSKNIVHHQ